MASDIIVAHCSGEGRGAISVIRLSGAGACALVDRAARLSSGKLLSDAGTHTIHHGFISGESSDIDEVLFLVMHAPRTFTGEETVEITGHNNQLLIKQVIDRLCALGARRAQPGEFSERAFLNNKLDLVQAEAIHDLIMATSEEGLKSSFAQLQGSLSAVLAEIEQSLIMLTAWVEASFEFLDEEQRDLGFEARVSERIASVQEIINRVLASASHAQQVREGFKIALIGSVNAGKSTLLNTLLGKERAIVSDQAGTTRDSIEAGLSYNGQFWTFIDTAGLRETDNSIEQAGIVRSYRAADESDALLLVCDSSRNLGISEPIYQKIIEEHGKKSILVLSKTDLLKTPENYPEEISALIACAKKNNIPVYTTKDDLKQAINSQIKALYNSEISPYLLNKRHLALIHDLDKQIKVIASRYPDEIEYELMAYHLKQALEFISSLTGQGVNEKVMDTVFRSFCVGK